jgi:thioesterase domain-containing protein/acyl carrier protein
VENVSDLFPLTPTQRGILFHALSSDDPEVYLEQLRFDLRGPLDPTRLSEALGLTIERQPMLRTMFVWDVGPKPLQIVRDVVPNPLVVDDHRDGPVPDLDSIAAEIRRGGIRLDVAPVAQARLILLNDECAHLIWTSHHVLLDGWSSALLFAEWFDVYEQLVRGETPRREPAPAFRDYIAWLKDQPAERAEEFWSGYFEGFVRPVMLEQLPATRPRAGSDRTERSLTDVQTAAVERYARERRLTASAVMLGAWGLVVARHGDADDVVVGSTTSGRPPELVDVDTMVGMFSTTIPVRVRIERSVSVESWLAGLNRARLDAQPFEHVALSGVRRHVEVPDGSALFDSILVYENYPISTTGSDTTIRRSLRAGSDRSHYALDLMILPGPELRCVAVFDTARFDTDLVDDILDQFVRAVMCIVEGEASTVGQLQDAVGTDRGPVDPPPAERSLAAWLGEGSGASANSRWVDLAGVLTQGFDSETVDVPADVAVDPARLTRFLARSRINAVVIGTDELDQLVTEIPNVARRLATVQSWTGVGAIAPRQLERIVDALPNRSISLVVPWRPEGFDADVPLGVRVETDATIAEEVLPPPIDGGRFVVLEGGRRCRSGVPGTLHLLRAGSGELVATGVRARLRVDGSAVSVVPPARGSRDDPIDREAEPPDPTVDASSDHGHVWTAMRRLWSEMLGVETIDPDADFFQLGGQSSDAVLLFARVKHEFGVDVPLAALLRHSTLRQIVGIVERRDAVAAEPDGIATTELGRRARSGRCLHLVELTQGDPDRIPLLVVHGGGGNVVNLRALAAGLGDDQPFYAFQAAGVDGIQTPHDSVSEMVAAYADEVEGALDGPVVLGGYSGGGVIAMELAHRLRSNGVDLASLVLLDTFHPSIQPLRSRLRTHLIRLFRGTVSEVGASTGRGLDYIRLAVRNRRQRESRDTDAFELLRAADERHELVPYEARELVLAWAMFDAVQASAIRPYDGPTVLFASETEWESFRHLPPDRGWSALIPDLTIVRTPGDHNTLVHPPHVDKLARSLRTHLDDLQSSVSDILEPAG